MMYNAFSMQINFFERREIKFLVVGGLNTAIGFIIFYICYYFFIEKFDVIVISISSSVINFLIATLNHHLFVFKVRNVNFNKIIFRSMISYVWLWVLTAVLNKLFLDTFQLNFWVAQIIINVLVLPITFLTHNRFTFKS